VCMKVSVAKKQFKLYFEEELIERLSAAGRRYGRGTPQQVVEEIIETYLPLWSTVNTATSRAIETQMRRLSEDPGPDEELGEERSGSGKRTRPVPYDGEITDGKQKRKKQAR
jgi:hypothetical protein